MPLGEDDLSETIAAFTRNNGNKHKAAAQLGISERQLRRRLNHIKETGGKRKKEKWETPNIEESPFAITHPPSIGSHDGSIWQLKSDKHNRYRIAAFGDLHAASKYCRWDVREKLMKRAEDFGATAILDTGNWIDGEASFNRYDLEAVGMDNQLDLLAEKYPKTRIPTYAVTGADHEGWYIKREGINVGRHCEAVMRNAGHPWTCLGYVEADILLVNSNTGATSICRVAHPGGGSAYALSYKPQKIIESYEGGEKPAVVFLGHYHKIECGNVRNVWYGQTGCSQDQTPFLRTRSIEAHLGGLLVELHQDPETGAITTMRPEMIKYFNKGAYVTEGRANNRWSGHGPITPVPRL